jgi:hypothetical protein
VIYKIIKPEIQNLLESINGSEGTIIFLEILKSIWQGLVCPTTSSLTRLECVSFAVHFVRYWRVYLHHNNIDSKHFISKNSWDCLELNFVWLIRLMRDGEAENVHEQNSQNNEAFFRKIRSFSSLESTMVNCDAKLYQSRCHKIAYEDKVAQELEGIIFPKVENKKKRVVREPRMFEESEIKDCIQKGILKAQNLALTVGISCFDFDIGYFLKPREENVKRLKKSSGHEVKNPLGVTGNPLDESDEEIDRNLTLQNVTFTSDHTGIF